MLTLESIDNTINTDKYQLIFLNISRKFKVIRFIHNKHIFINITIKHYIFSYAIYIVFCIQLYRVRQLKFYNSLFLNYATDKILKGRFDLKFETFLNRV